VCLATACSTSHWATVSASGLSTVTCLARLECLERELEVLGHRQGNHDSSDLIVVGHILSGCAHCERRKTPFRVCTIILPLNRSSPRVSFFKVLFCTPFDISEVCRRAFGRLRYATQLGKLLSCASVAKRRMVCTRTQIQLLPATATRPIRSTSSEPNMERSPRPP
jgi:hypothetical protein